MGIGFIAWNFMLGTDFYSYGLLWRHLYRDASSSPEHLLAELVLNEVLYKTLSTKAPARCPGGDKVS